MIGSLRIHCSRKNGATRLLRVYLERNEFRGNRGSVWMNGASVHSSERRRFRIAP
jgi:hypothetical protein